MIKISCIIPAYNEGERIKKILKVVKNNPLLDEVIVINDGSTDNTEKIIRKFKKLKVISYEKNRGKSYAIYVGLKNSRNNIILTLDSDLVGLTKENIKNILYPVANNLADVSMALWKNDIWFYKMLGMDFISGLRVFNKKLISNPEILLKIPGYGIEVFINKKIIEQKLRIAVVKWNNVTHPRKSEKTNPLMGLLNDWRMTFHIIKIAGFFGMIYQVLKLLSLRIKV